MVNGDGVGDLLYGILAVRMNLISGDALIAALDAWSLEAARPLGEVLAETALTPEHREQLEPLVRAHRERPIALSTACPVAGETADPVGEGPLRVPETAVPAVRGSSPSTLMPSTDRLSSVGSPSTRMPTTDPFSTIDPGAVAGPSGRPGGGTGSRPTDEDPTAGQVDPGASSSATGTRYPIMTLHRRGGLGEVYIARDPELDREVALKQIRNKYADEPRSRARFLREAKITGTLEHPGIVPVYGLGQYADGRPFYAMRFIRGESLRRAIETFHRARVKDPEAGARVVELHQLLRQFVAVCNTVAYAHGRGVLHRDLKPENVMLGEFGETLVVDWGLAKAMNAPEPAAGGDPGAGKSGSGSGPTLATQVGTRVGTPFYMSPEQASGRIDELGPASDIYSLGATLYALLTGQVPIEDPSADRILPPGQVSPGLDPALEAICWKAMAPEPQVRYPTAIALASDIDHWLADEPVSVYREPGRRRLARWARRHRAWVQAGAVALMAIALIAVGAAVSIRHAWWQETILAAREGRRLETVRAEAESQVFAGQEAAARQDWARAHSLLTAAMARIRPEKELASLAALAAPLLAEAERHLADQAALQEARDTYEQFRGFADEARFHASQLIGLDPATSRAASCAAIRAALDRVDVDEAEGTGGPVLSHPYLVERREEITATCAEMLLLLAEAEAPTPVDRTAPEDRVSLQRALRILDRAGRLGPSFWAYHLQRADCLTRLGDEAGAQEERQRASLRSAGAFDRFQLGLLRHFQGDPAAALPHFEEALGLRPNDFWAQYHVAICLLKLDRPAEARAHLTACISRRPEFVWSYVVRGYALGELDQTEAAEGDFRTAEGLRPDAPARYAILVNRGRMRLLCGRLEGAHADLKAAIALLPERHEAYVNRAQVYRAQKKWDEAVALLERAIEMAPDLAGPYRDRARIRSEHGEPAAAVLKDFDSAIKREAGCPRDLAEDHVDRGLIFYRDGRYEEAVAAYDAALVVQPELAPAHRYRAAALEKLGRDREAVAALDRSLTAGGTDVDVYRLRGLLRKALGQTAGAVEDFTRALEIGQDSPNMRTKRGWAYLLEGWALALQDFDRALELSPTNSDAHAGRGYALVLLGRVGEGVEAAEQAVHFAPDVPDLIYNAACVYAQAVGKVPAEGDLAARYGARSLDLIRQALKLLPPEQRATFWREAIAPDAALNPIRHTDGYRRLEAEYRRQAE